MSDYTTTVADLLEQSHRAHMLYQQHLPRMAAVSGSLPQPQAGDLSEAQKWLKEAASARAQAQLIDPKHESPAWANEAAQYPHDELSLFYLQQLSK